VLGHGRRHDALGNLLYRAARAESGVGCQDVFCAGYEHDFSADIVPFVFGYSAYGRRE